MSTHTTATTPAATQSASHLTWAMTAAIGLVVFVLFAAAGVTAGHMLGMTGSSAHHHHSVVADHLDNLSPKTLVVSLHHA